MSSHVGAQNKKQDMISILGGTIVSIAITLILILLFALLIRFFDISDNLIFPINQVIKVISMIIGISVLLRKNKSYGFLKGILLGLLYFVLSYIIFSILQGSFSWSFNNFFDLLLTMLMGGLIGIILVNIGRR
jgi:putative membrane protein (TIGR04086 family)